MPVACKTECLVADYSNIRVNGYSIPVQKTKKTGKQESNSNDVFKTVMSLCEF
jgi:hypothetical protein